MANKITLISNIDFIHHEGLRLKCHALLIEPGDEGLFSSPRLRGFGTSGCAPIFTRWIASTDYTLTPSDSRRSAELLTHTGEMKPLLSGANLTIDDQKYFLQAHNQGFPFDEADVSTLKPNYDLIWQALERKVEEYWPERQYMPRNQWAPPLHRKSG